MRETILEEAERIVGGDRRKEYGDVGESFLHISDLWSAYLGHQVTISDVAHMMMLLKISRNRIILKRDNLVDACGYARCLEMLMEQAAISDPKVC